MRTNVIGSTSVIFMVKTRMRSMINPHEDDNMSAVWKSYNKYAERLKKLRIIDTKDNEIIDNR